MGFNDWINFEPAPMSAYDRLEAVDQLTREKVAGRLQSALRTTVDVGVDLHAAVRAQKIRVVADESRFVVDSEDQGDVLLNEERELEPGDPNEVDDVDELFKMSDGVPSVGKDGRLVYRSITPAALLGEQQREAREQQLEQTVTETIRNSFIESFEDAMQEIDRKR